MTLLIVVVSLMAVYSVRYLIWYFSQVDYRPDGPGTPVGGDFAGFWLAAKFLFGHAAAHIYHIPTFTAFELSHITGGEGPFHSWSHPPVALLLMAPLGLMPYTAAYAAFMALTFLLYAMLASGLRPKLWFVVLLLLSPAATVTLIGGQTGFLTAGLLIGGILLLDRRPVWSGILFGLLAIEPQLGLLIPIALIAGGLWRPFFAAVATGVALVWTSIFFYGFDIWPAYLEAISALRETPPTLQPTILAAMHLWGAAPPVAYAAQAVVTLGLAAGIWALFRKSTDRPLQAAAIGFAVLLTTPYGVVYDMPAVAISCIILGWRGFNEGFLPYERLALIAGWVLPLAVMTLNPLHMPVAPLVLLALFALTMRRALNPELAASAMPVPALSR